MFASMISLRSEFFRLYYGVDTIMLLGWGKTLHGGVEMWDSSPVFKGRTVDVYDRCRLFFYPKKWVLYRALAQEKKKKDGVFRVLDAGCGTGSSVIDLSKLLGPSCEVVGVDVVKLQIDIAQKRLREHRVSFQSRVEWYDGEHLPYPDGHFDAIYTSDVLGHVGNVPLWLSELSRVLAPGGTLAMFSESSLGRHALIRRYLFSKGVNVDPHADFHISLYSKQELQGLLVGAGFSLSHMYTTFLFAFFLHPDEFYPALSREKRFPVLRGINRFLFNVKQSTHPYSTALVELYGLLEMLTLGRVVESQGYVILAKKR